MSTEFPVGSKADALTERRAAVMAEAVRRVEAGDVRGGLEVALREVCPKKNIVDLRTEQAVDVNLDDWDETIMGDHEEQERVNDALNLVVVGDAKTTKKWIVAMLTSHEDVALEEALEDWRGAHRPIHQEVELAGLTPEACRKKLVEKWITSNPAIPDPVKAWTLKLLEHHPKMFTSPTTTEVHVTYDEKDRDGQSVIIRYRTTSGYVNQSFREHHLKWFT